MRRVVVSLLAFAMALAPLGASPQAADKIVTNVKGSVAAGPGSKTQAPTNPVALHAQVSLNDSDWVSTQASSQAHIGLPDSSVVLVGQSSNVQLISFDNASAAAAFYVVGKVRFQVEHPHGAAANYTFQTETGQIAVRGTVGDIFSSPQGLQVNVYAISNPALPVQVTLANGQIFSLAAGQSLVATAAAGAVTASTTTVTQSLFSPFQEFGAPVNASALGISGAAAGGAASGAAAGTAAGIAAGAAAAAGIIVTSTNKSTPSTTPAPSPSTTSVPITVTGRGRPGGRPSPQP